MSYAGSSIPIPLGDAGLKTDSPMVTLPPNALIKANNISLFHGRLEKALGTTKYNTTALDSAIVACFDWWPDPITQRLIALTDDGKIWRDTGSTTFNANTPIKTGLNASTTDSHMVACGAEDSGRSRKLFVLTGTNQIQVLTGDSTSVTALSKPSPDWASGNFPSFAIGYQNRVCVMNSAANRHQLYFSMPDDHENFVGEVGVPLLANTQWALWTIQASETNVGASIQAGNTVTILPTTNNYGFMLQGDVKFDTVVFNVTQAQTGSPVYAYQYWNGTSWVTLPLLTTPSYTSTGSKTLHFTPPTDWALGHGTDSGSDTRYAIKVLATTAPTQAVQINSMTLTNTLTYDIFPVTQSVYPGEGDGILCAAVYRGLLFIFKKPYGVYILDGRDPNTDNWTVSKYSDAFGVASPHSVLQVLGDLVAANAFGTLTSLQASDAFGDFEAGDILANAQIEAYIQEQFNVAGLPYSQAIYYAHKKQALFTAQSETNLVRDRMLVLDVARQTPRITINTKDQANCLALRKDSTLIPKPMYGDQAGFINLMDQPTYNVNGASFIGEFQTPYTDFSFASSELGGKNKIFDFLEVNYVATGNNTFNCDVYVDGSFRQTLVFTQVLGVALDSFILDVDKLAGDAVGSRDRRPLRSCTGVRISLRFYNNSFNAGFKIERAIISFRLSAEQVYAAQR